MGGGKTRSSNQSGRLVAPFVQNEVMPGFGSIKDQQFSQLAEALRTGGIGAQIPIVQQSVSQSQDALSRSLAGTQDQLASSGLAGTPFGQRVMAGARTEGEQGIARIPTDYAQQQVQQVPQLVQGLLSAMLGSLAASSQGGARGGTFNT